MTRKDFELIARVLKTWEDSLGQKRLRSMAEDFADDLQATNAEFDRTRFLRMCGVINADLRPAYMTSWPDDIGL